MEFYKPRFHLFVTLYFLILTLPVYLFRSIAFEHVSQVFSKSLIGNTQYDSVFGVRSTPTAEFCDLQENLTELNPASHNPTHQLIARRNEKWAANVFQIVSWNRRTPSTPIYTMYAKTDALRKRWISAFNLAIENNSPPGYKDNGHIFEMHTFREPSECNVCQRLLKGSFLQVR